ncbi:hypothetical protein EAH_00063470, partial [Eimeria acervulina]
MSAKKLSLPVGSERQGKIADSGVLTAQVATLCQAIEDTFLQMDVQMQTAENRQALLKLFKDLSVGSQEEGEGKETDKETDKETEKETDKETAKDSETNGDRDREADTDAVASDSEAAAKETGEAEKRQLAEGSRIPALGRLDSTANLGAKQQQQQQQQKQQKQQQQKQKAAAGDDESPPSSEHESEDNDSSSPRTSSTASSSSSSSSSVRSRSNDSSNSSSSSSPSAKEQLSSPSAAAGSSKKERNKDSSSSSSSSSKEVEDTEADEETGEGSSTLSECNYMSPAAAAAAAGAGGGAGEDDDDVDEEAAAAAAAAEGQQRLEHPHPSSPEGAGTTAVVVIVVRAANPVLIIANAGDSRGAYPLSHDHKPMNPAERARIAAAGGCVMNGRVDGNLNLSRSLGDLFYKSDAHIPPEKQRITSFPDVRVTPVHKDDEFLIIACDGIWDCKTNQEAVDFVRSHLSSSKKSRAEALRDACEALCDNCLSPDPIKSE